MRKIFKKVLVAMVLVAMIVTVAMLAGCKKTYVQEAKFGNADYNNMTRTLVLVNDTEYTYEVISLDSQDSSKMTAHLTLQGKYEVLEEGKTIKIDFASSTGHFDAWAGDVQQLNQDLDGSTAEGLTGVITWYGMCTDGSSSGVINLDGKTFEAEVAYE